MHFCFTVQILCDSGKKERHPLERFPAKRFGTPADLDAAVIFFSSEAGSYVNGQTICVDGGFNTGGIPAPSSDDPPSIG